ncbi:hypothetical protein CSKR_101933 [Clonorchis sinensis]|uniref:Uncharacterized protein n=1 Tax=Clonorchis sinensis TaxID=79923 RepID=A0A419QBG9_CLOSI|nr:hypothetical protein CSKR_101933 [Clonorchis sinensis]
MPRSCVSLRESVTFSLQNSDTVQHDRLDDANSAAPLDMMLWILVFHRYTFLVMCQTVSLLFSPHPLCMLPASFKS